MRYSHPVYETFVEEMEAWTIRKCNGECKRDLPMTEFYMHPKRHKNGMYGYYHKGMCKTCYNRRGSGYKTAARRAKRSEMMEEFRIWQCERHAARKFGGPLGPEIY